MKRITFLVLAVLISVASQAQNFRWGVTAGVNLDKPTITFRPITARWGCFVGVKVIYDMPFAKGLYATSGLNFSHHQWHWEFEKTEDWFFDYQTLQLPLHIGYRQALSDNFALFAEVGPTFSCGLFGTWQRDYYSEITPYSRKEYELYKTRYDRLTWSLSARIGAEFIDKIRVSVGYDHGMTDAWKGKRTSSVKLRTYSASVAYMF